MDIFTRELFARLELLVPVAQAPADVGIVVGVGEGVLRAVAVRGVRTRDTQP